MDKLPVSKQFFTHHLRTALAFCNLDLQRYQSHSFRIGAATTAASLGFSEIQIDRVLFGITQARGESNSEHAGILEPMCRGFEEW